MFFLFLKYQLNKLIRYFRTRRTAKFITSALFVAVIGAVAFGIYLFFREGFGYIGANPYFRDALNLYVFELYLLMIMVLVVFSSFVTIIFSLFRGRMNNWIMVSPGFRLLPVHTLFRVFLHSLWPLFIIVLPGLLALRSVYGLDILGLGVPLLSVILLIAMTVIGIFITIIIWAGILLLISSWTRISALSLKILTVVIIAVFIAKLIFIWHYSLDTDLISLFRAEDLNRTSVGIELISDQFRFFPSHPAAYCIYAAINGEQELMLAEFVMLLTMFVMASTILWIVLTWFLAVWQRLQEGSFSAEAGDSYQSGRRAVRFTGGPTRAILTKEVLIFRRDLRGILWFSFLFLVWLAQTGLNIVLGRNIAAYRLSLEAAPVMIQVLEFATAAFFASALVLRFAFGAFSSERRTAWILASAPVKQSRIFGAKLLFFLPVFTVIGLVVGYTNLAVLDMPLLATGISLGLFIGNIIFITVFGLCLGAIFPNFETDDPSVLSTTMPGLAFILGSLAYGFAGAYMLYWILGGGQILPVAVFIAGSALLLVGLVFKAIRSLHNMDFVKTV